MHGDIPSRPKGVKGRQKDAFLLKQGLESGDIP